MKTFISAFLTVSLLFSNTSFAQTSATQPTPAGQTFEVPDFSANDSKFSSPALKRRPTDARAYFGPQLVSMLLPGFDQWYEGQYQAAALYSALYIGGTALSAPDIRLNTEDEDASSDDDDEETTDLDDRGSFNRQRI